jgi:hypothetical protein
MNPTDANALVQAGIYVRLLDRIERARRHATAIAGEIADAKTLAHEWADADEGEHAVLIASQLRRAEQASDLMRQLLSDAEWITDSQELQP